LMRTSGKMDRKDSGSFTGAGRKFVPFSYLLEVTVVRRNEGTTVGKKRIRKWGRIFGNKGLTEGFGVISML